MKIYELKFEVRKGESTFSYQNLFEAKDYEDAERLAHKWCCDFYGVKGEQLDDYTYEFPGACAVLKIESVLEITDIEEWKEKQYKKAFITII